MKFTPSSKLPAGETDRLLGYMPIVVRADGVSDWERKFCASIISRQRGKSFAVSEKQARIMNRIVSAFQERTMRADGEVVE